MIEFNLFDERLKEMLTNLNVALVHVANKISEGKFESGDVNLKISISTVTGFYETDDEYGYLTTEPYEMPIFNFKITTNLQKKDVQSGKIVVKDKKFYAGNNGVLYLEDVKRAQMSIEDYENNKEINYGK